MYLNNLFLVLLMTGCILFPRLSNAQIIPDSTITNPLITNSTEVVEANKVIEQSGEVLLVNQVDYPIKNNIKACLL